MKKGEEKGQDNSEQNSKEQENIGNAQLLKIVAELRDKMDKMEAEKKEAVSFPVSQGMSADDVAKIISAVKAQEKDIDYSEGIREEDIPEDDFDEKGARFCAPFVGYVVVDDKRKGHRVKLPYNKKSIFFEYGATRRIQQGKYEAIAPYCVYQSHSKKEIEWLKAHTHYGIFFYESSTQAVGADVLKMQKLARIMTILHNYEFIDLIKRCKEYNVAVGEDPAAMRANLAFEMVKVEMDSETMATQRALNETLKHATLVGKANG